MVSSGADHNGAAPGMGPTGWAGNSPEVRPGCASPVRYVVAPVPQAVPYRAGGRSVARGMGSVTSYGCGRGVAG